MREILERLIEDFQEQQLPAPVRRDACAPDVAGKAMTVVGMRRAGKTWFCFQRMRALLDAGVAKRRSL